MKWRPTIRNSCNGRKIRDVASPWTLNPSRVHSTQASNRLDGGVVLTGTGRAPRKISDHVNRRRIARAVPDLNKVHNQGIHDGGATTLSGLHGVSAPGAGSIRTRQEMEERETPPKASAQINTCVGPSLRLHEKNGIVTQINVAQSFLPDPAIGRFLGTRTLRILRKIAHPDYHLVVKVTVGAIPVVDSRNVGGPGGRKVAIGPGVVLNDRKCPT